MKTIFLLFPLFVVSTQYKFLVYSPVFGHSHTTFLNQIADTLTAAGHNVTVFAPVMDETLLDKKNNSITKNVIRMKVDPRVRVLYQFMHKAAYAEVWEMSPNPLEFLRWARNMSLVFGHTCENVLKQEKLLEELRSYSFDVAIAEPLHICGFALFDYLGIPASIGAVSTAQADLVSYHMGEPLAPSYVPTLLSPNGEKMTLLQRFGNVFNTGLGYKFMNEMYSLEFEAIQNKFGDIYSIEELLAKNSFLFVNSNPYLNFPRPIIHKTVEIGGISVDLSRIGKLDEKWDTVLNERRHTVFISFGSVAKSIDMPEEFRKSIVSVCKSLANVTFIWKYEKESSLADDIPNLYLSPWLPQNALLADKRLSLFISHGGLGSTTELAHFGKPAIMIPLFGEQARNSAMLARHKGALVMRKEDLASPELLKRTILEILNNQNYAENAKRLSQMLKEQPISAKDLVLTHAVFAAKFGSLPNLDPYGRHLSMIQYYLIDVFAVVLLFLLLILFIVFKIGKFACRLIFCREKKVKNE